MIINTDQERLTKNIDKLFEKSDYDFKHFLRSWREALHCKKNKIDLDVHWGLN